MYLSIDTSYLNGGYYPNNCIKSEEDYTPEELEKLYAGEGVPCEWDEDGEPTAWDYINESML